MLKTQQGPTGLAITLCTSRDNSESLLDEEAAALLQAPSGCLTPDPISKAKPSNHTQENHFDCLYQQSHSLSHFSRLVTKGEGWNVNRLIN